MKDNLTVIDGYSKKDSEMASALRELQNNVEIHMEYQKITSKLLREKYKSLISEGFTESQALELCKISLF